MLTGDHITFITVEERAVAVRLTGLGGTNESINECFLEEHLKITSATKR